MANDIKLFLDDPFQQAWQEQDPFDAAFSLEGEVFRARENRKTLRFELGGQSYFVKVHQGARFREIVKNLLQLRLPVVSARNEWRAIQRLRGLGIETLNAKAYGLRGILPWNYQSFLITEDVGRVSTLEDICENWSSEKPGFCLKRAIIERLAAVSQTLHQNGICHRDYYLCHFMVLNTDPLNLCLIDLHRALIKHNLRKRWVVKDVGSLYFSALDIGLTRGDLYRFMKVYSGKSLRCTLQEDSGFWLSVKRRAISIRRKTRDNPD